MALDKPRRSLNTSFYTDPYIEDLSRDERDVYLTLLLNPQNNLSGVYEISLKKLADYAKMQIEDVRKAVNVLMDDGKILYINSWVAIKNQIKNQAINPNMAKSVVDILRQVPMTMKVFVLLNDQGELESWTKNLFEKLQDYHNRRIAIDLRKKKIQFDPDIHGLEYTQESFMNDINGIDTSKVSNIKPLQTLSKRFKPFEKKEGESEVESEGEGGTEIETETLSVFPPSIHQNDPEQEFDPDDPFNDIEIPDRAQRHQHTNEDVDKIIAYANAQEVFPPERRLLVNFANAGQLLDALSYYSKPEIKQSIDNYSICIRAPDKYRVTPFRSLENFIVNQGIPKYLDSAKPLERYLQQKSSRETEEERLRRISAEAHEREKELEAAERRKSG